MTAGPRVVSRSEPASVEVDFPAAHSMDTTWFAVDGKGQVGCFETGPDGVVPASWYWMPDILEQKNLWRAKAYLQSHGLLYDLGEDLLLQLVRAAGETLIANQRISDDDRRMWSTNPYLQDVRDKPWLAVLGPEPENHAPMMVSWFDPAWHPQSPPVIEGVNSWGLVLVVRPSFSLESDFRGEELFADTERRVLLVERIPATLYRRMHKEKACRGCFVISDQPHRMGVFHYEYDGDLRYTRIGTPTDPLLADGLPVSLRKYLALVDLRAVDFSSASAMDLNERVFCIAYGDSYWLFDRATNTVRLDAGEREDPHYGEYLRQYREAYPLLAAWAQSQGYAIEPPPQD